VGFGSVRVWLGGARTGGVGGVDPRSLAQGVGACRYSKGWGPAEVASRAEISRTALYQIESGKTELPRAGTLRRIALALDVPMETLLVPAKPETLPTSPHPPGATTRKTHRAGVWMSPEGGPLTSPLPP